MYNTDKVMMGFAIFLIPNIYCKLVCRVCSPVSAENIVLHLPLRMGLKIVYCYTQFLPRIFVLCTNRCGKKEDYCLLTFHYTTI